MRALAEVEASECKGCGYPIEEAWTADADRNLGTGTHYYRVAPPTVCHACAQLGIAQKDAEATGFPIQSLHYMAERVNR